MTPPTVDREELFQLRSDVDIVVARKEVRDWSVSIGLSTLEMTKVVTAASELARNALVHGGGGEMRMQLVRQADRRGIRIIFTDEGPGIADVALAMRDGYTSAGGMGIGLPGSKRLVNEFDMTSTPTDGTRVTIVRWKR